MHLMVLVLTFREGLCHVQLTFFGSNLSGLGCKIFLYLMILLDFLSEISPVSLD